MIFKGFPEHPLIPQQPASELPAVLPIYLIERSVNDKRGANRYKDGVPREDSTGIFKPRADTAPALSIRAGNS
jgi:hypothetical protein